MNTAPSINAHRYYRTKPRYKDDPGEVVWVTRVEKWRNGWWAHVRFAGDSRSGLMIHENDLEEV